MAASDAKALQVYRWLLAYIDKKKFSEDQKLPSENALSYKLGVSRETIRAAIDLLVKEEIVYKIKGSGTYFYKEKILSKNLHSGNALIKIGVVLQGQNSSASSEVLAGIQSVLSKDDVDVHVFLTDNKFSNERRCLQTVVYQNFHGFIVDGVKASIMNPNLDCYDEIYRRQIPVIFYNNFYKELPYPRVIINDHKCADELVGRLIDAGHRKMAGIFVYDNYQSVEKFLGMAEAMRKRRVDLIDHYIKWCISDEAHNPSYARTIEKFLKGLPKCTAIVCCNYLIYKLVRQVLEKKNKSIPDDFSVVCFDYSSESWKEDDITCSLDQGYTIGQELAKRLMRMIYNQDCTGEKYTCVLKPVIFEGHSIKHIMSS